MQLVEKKSHSVSSVTLHYMFCGHLFIRYLDLDMIDSFCLWLIYAYKIV